MIQDVARLSIAIDSSQVQQATADLQKMHMIADGLGKGLLALLGLNSLKSLVKESTMLAARFDALGRTMGVLTANMGYSRDGVARFEAGLRGLGISAVGARQSVINMAKANIDLAQSSKLAKAAQDLAAASGANAVEVLEQLTQGIHFGNARTLRSIGLNVQFKDALDDVAAAGGRSVKQLSEKEKVQARINEILKDAARFEGAHEAALSSTSKQLAGMSRRIEDFKLQLGEVFQPAFAEAVRLLTDNVKAMGAALSTASANGDILLWGRKFRTTVESIIGVVKGSIEFIVKHKNAIIALLGAYAGYKVMGKTEVALRAIWQLLKSIPAVAAGVIAGFRGMTVAANATTTAVAGTDAALTTMTGGVWKLVTLLGTAAAAWLTYSRATKGAKGDADELLEIMKEEASGIKSEITNLNEIIFKVKIAKAEKKDTAKALADAEGAAWSVEDDPTLKNASAAARRVQAELRTAALDRNLLGVGESIISKAKRLGGGDVDKENEHYLRLINENPKAKKLQGQVDSLNKIITDLRNDLPIRHEKQLELDKLRGEVGDNKGTNKALDDLLEKRAKFTESLKEKIATYGLDEIGQLKYTAESLKWLDQSADLIGQFEKKINTSKVNETLKDMTEQLATFGMTAEQLRDKKINDMAALVGAEPGKIAQIRMLAMAMDEATRAEKNAKELKDKLDKLEQGAAQLAHKYETPDEFLARSMDNLNDMAAYLPFEKYKKAVADIRLEHAKMRSDAGDVWAEVGLIVHDNAGRASDAILGWMNNLDGLGRTWRTLGDTVRSVIADMILQLQRYAMEQLVMNSAMSALGGWLGGFGVQSGPSTTSQATSSPGTFNLGGQTIPLAPRAGGGTVLGGSTYLVGERGPELFEAPATGRIVPNHHLASRGGGDNISVSIVQNIHSDGRAKTQTSGTGGSQQMWAEMAKQIESIALRTIQKEKRMGGELNRVYGG